MITETQPISKSIPSNKPFIAFDSRPFIATLLFCVVILFIPSLYVRAVIILVLGIQISSYERVLGLPIPVTPGTMLWLGSTLSYVIGGIGSHLFFRQANDIGLPYLENALLYLGLGIASYAFGLLLVGQHLGPSARDTKRLFGLNLSPARISIFTSLFVLPVVGKSLDFGGSSFDVYYNLVIGPIQSIEHIPMIMFAFYLLQPRRIWWLGLLLLAASLAVPWEDMLVGYGRNKLPYAIMILILTYMTLVWYSDKRISLQFKLLIFILPIAIIIFFSIVSIYREEVRFQRDTIGNERIEILQQSVNEFTQASDVLATIEPILTRFIEKPSLELLSWAENGEIEKVGWTFEDTKQVVLSWIPKVFFLEKGEGYGRDIMEYYGLSPSWNNIPVTILTDSYRRGGVFGVMSMYFLMGLASTAIVLKLQPRWGVLGLTLVLFFALQHFRIYSEDVLEVIKLYVYRLPSSGFAIYAILYLSKILATNVADSNNK